MRTMASNLVERLRLSVRKASVKGSKDDEDEARTERVFFASHRSCKICQMLNPPGVSDLTRSNEPKGTSARRFTRDDASTKTAPWFSSYSLFAYWIKGEHKLDQIH